MTGESGDQASMWLKNVVVRCFDLSGSSDIMGPSIVDLAVPGSRSSQRTEITMLIRCVCGQKYNAREKLAGLMVRCRKCGQHLQVPTTSEAVVMAPLPVAAPTRDPATGQPVYPPGPAGHADAMSLGGISDHQMDIGPAHGMAQVLPNRPVPARPKKVRVKVDYTPVNRGIKLIFAGTVTSILCAVATAIVFATGVVAIAALLLLGVFIGVVLAMVGYVFCIWVPARTEARPLIIAATICNGLNIIVSLMRTLITAADSSAESPVLDFLSIGLGAATMILFLLFIRKVAEYVENYEAAHDAWSLLIFYISMAGIAIGFVISIFLVGPFLGSKALVIYLLVGALSVLIVAVIWMVYFLNFINSLEFRKRPRRY